MTVWFYDPSILFRNSKILKFWPTSNQSVDERVNSTTRFILYVSLVIYLIKRDARVLLLALMVLGVLFILYKSNVITPEDNKSRPSASGDFDYSPNCQLPSRNNPMANVLLNDYEDDPTRPPACYYPTVKNDVQLYMEDTIPYDAGRSRSSLPKYQQRAAARQFISMPSTTIPNHQTDFAEWCYGKKDRPMCRDDPSVCNPNMRGAQLEAFAGLDPAGDMRTGMRGGGNGPPGTTVS